MDHASFTALKKLATDAKRASADLATLPTATKNRALLAMARALRVKKASILAENKKDVWAAQKQGLPMPIVKRLELDSKKMGEIADAVARVSKLPDPVGRVLMERRRPNGLKIRKISVPLGVILIIYESRPNVTADCMALCLKSGNAVILKSGREAMRSARAIFSVMRAAAEKCGVPKGSFELVTTPGRSAVEKLLTMKDEIGLVIPRGGEGLIRRVAEISKIPVIKHYKGVCHVYVDRRADFDKSLAVIVNAKTQKPEVCNAAETLLVHQDAAKKFLPRAAETLKTKGVELRGCERTRAVVPWMKKATEEDWYAEYLDLILAVRVVKSLDDAVRHIRKYGSAHSDAILTEDKKAAQSFCGQVDSSAVFVNASTRFNDGGEFGMGAEMGISTDKLHVRGPMGLEELTSYKYVVLGDGQVREH